MNLSLNLVKTFIIHGFQAPWFYMKTNIIWLEKKEIG